MSQEEKFYTKKNLCKLFGVTRRTIMRWVHLGKLPKAIIRKMPYEHLWRTSQIDKIYRESRRKI